jgi:hypothetical protein
MSETQQRNAGCRIGRDYPEPIIDHAQERRGALMRYGAAALKTSSATRKELGQWRER